MLENILLWRLRIRQGSAAAEVDLPVLYAELHGAGDDGRDDLAPEHRSWWDLHIMTELEVGREDHGWIRSSAQYD